MINHEFIPIPTIFDISRWWRCRVRILIVTDGSGGFSEGAGFHLGQILKILNDDPWHHIEFQVNKAHRGNSNEQDVDQNFRFDQQDLSIYSQIWLFGILTTGTPLSQTELKALAQFMDSGGGVFATGDHRNLGQAMCAEVPRVRSMRRWYWPVPGPDGEPVAPDQFDASRNDTVMNLAAGGDQSDATPQPIRPRFYQRFSFHRFVSKVVKYPHQVLCGPDGVIEYLPDHMHEGLCERPSDLSKTFTFDDYTTAEYPTVSGHRQEPEVIAWAEDRNSGGEEFGVIAAYDGHRVNRGRVVVDATWHHWFNINLTGFINATNPAHPSYDPAVIPKWEAIKAYFRNVGVWLARPNLQRCIRNGGWLVLTRYYDVIITAQDVSVVHNPFAHYWQIGLFAKDALGRLASQCQTTQWVLDTLDIPELLADPWLPTLPDPPMPPFDADEIEIIALGGAIHAVSMKFADADFDELMEDEGRSVEAVATAGAAEAVSMLFERHNEAMKFAEGFNKKLKKRMKSRKKKK